MITPNPDQFALFDLPPPVPSTPRERVEHALALERANPIHPAYLPMLEFALSMEKLPHYLNDILEADRDCLRQDPRIPGFVWAVGGGSHLIRPDPTGSDPIASFRTLIINTLGGYNVFWWSPATGLERCTEQQAFERTVNLMRAETEREEQRWRYPPIDEPHFVIRDSGGYGLEEGTIVLGSHQPSPSSKGPYDKWFHWSYEVLFTYRGGEYRDRICRTRMDRRQRNDGQWGYWINRH